MHRPTPPPYPHHQILVVHPGVIGGTSSGARSSSSSKGKGKIKRRTSYSGASSGRGADAVGELPVEQQAFGVDHVPDDLQLSSGLTPPTAHIVQRRFEKTRRGKYTVGPRARLCGRSRS